MTIPVKEMSDNELYSLQVEIENELARRHNAPRQTQQAEFDMNTDEGLQEFFKTALQVHGQDGASLLKDRLETYGNKIQDKSISKENRTIYQRAYNMINDMYSRAVKLKLMQPVQASENDV